MKKLHLICNAHLDPVWMWDWDDGFSAAIATFRSAADLADEFDYIFCHNEAVLYDMIEKCDPPLFARIRALVKAGKWKIMGGWWLQPDVLFPSGEALVRQILLGRDYFYEKFGAFPTTALNFDSFGHPRSLVQILAQTGYDSYIFCRPMPELHSLPDGVFLWESADGSKVKAYREEGDFLYSSGLGQARFDSEKKLQRRAGLEVAAVLWGVGNHGGGPSRKDLRDMEQWKQEAPFEIVHSWPEAFFVESEPKKTYKKSLLPCLIKCYSSMHRIKEMHAEVERNLFTTEKMCSAAALACGFETDFGVLKQAERDLCSMEFHDVMSGTCAADGEKSCLAMGGHALTELFRLRFRAFCSLVSEERAAGEGEFPLFLFSPYPHETEAVVETEFLCPSAFISDDEYREVIARVNGKRVPCQVIKELSNINYDRRKRVAVRVTLPPLSLLRVDCKLETRPRKKYEWNGDICIADSVKRTIIDSKTGLMKSFCVHGREYLDGGAFQPFVYEDNADPWGWGMKKVGWRGKPMRFADRRRGAFRADAAAVRIVEDGDVLTVVESDFLYGSSCVTLIYKIYKELPFVDVEARVLWNERGRTLKLRVPCAFGGEYIGQTPYGSENFSANGCEHPVQRFSAIVADGSAFAVFNECVGGQSCAGRSMFLTLLNGSAYCAHPIGNRPLVDTGRDIPYIEEGRRLFRFRMAAIAADRLEAEADRFHQKVFAVNYFPKGNGGSAQSCLFVDDPAVSVPVFRPLPEGKFEIRLFNNTEKKRSVKLSVNGATDKFSLGKYRWVTVIYRRGKLQESSPDRINNF